MAIESDDPLFLDIIDLHMRGWTDALVRKHLGEPDFWAPVEHWANFTGKREWHLKRIEASEATPAFQQDYQASLRRRKTPPLEIDRYLSNRRQRSTNFPSGKSS